MALSENITNERTGHVNAYWRLTGCSIDVFTETVQIALSGYTDAAAREGGYAPDDRRGWNLPLSTFVAAGQGVQGATVYDAMAAICYGIIKTTGPEFAGAVDV